MKIYDTYSQELKEFIPLEEKKVKIYVCGPTVYDYPHLGHARCYITWDMVVRYLEFKGYDVTYVRNITDVDDKIINKAIACGQTPKIIAERYYQEFQSAMKALNIKSPTIEPRATDNIEQMVDIIKSLVDKGYAYSTGNGDVYFRVQKYTGYGRLSKQNLNELEAGARVESSEIKEDPLDFALWKAVKTEDEIGWESPWGKGRPGWHIECSAMVKKYLGTPIDIHAGGQDLIFPHHENERAQAETAFDNQFVKYWMHNGFVVINEEKMSKSLGNFITIKDILENYDANTIRFFIYTNHYRMPVDFNDESLRSAKAGIKRLKNAVTDVKSSVGEEKLVEARGILDKIVDEIAIKGEVPLQMLDRMHGIEESISAEAIEKIIKESRNFISAMDDDFNTAKALAGLFEVANCAQKAKDENEPQKAAFYLALLIKFSNIIGFDLTTQDELRDELISQLMDVIIRVRATVRNQKNWELSDKIRDELRTLNIVLKDQKDGKTVWKVEE